MKILVIDDSAQNVASAAQTLEGHDVTVIDNVQDAFDTLNGDKQFDAVLTDMMMPVGSFKGAMNTRDHARPADGIAVGLIFAIKAANKGCRTVICTDTNHHDNWYCALLDMLDGRYDSEAKEMVYDQEQRIAYVEARGACMEAVWDEGSKTITKDKEWYKKSGPQIKHWGEVMARSGLFPELEAKDD